MKHTLKNLGCPEDCKFRKVDGETVDFCWHESLIHGKCPNEKKEEIFKTQEEKKEVKSHSEEETIVKMRETYHKIMIQLKEYCDLREEYYPVVALWIIGTHCHDCFDTFPFLFINAIRGGGKTRLLKIIKNLCKNGELQASISEAVLFRTAKGNTILIDEFEHIGSKEKGTLRELLNAAYKRGMLVKRMKKVKENNQERQKVEVFDLYTPIAMANIWGMDEVLADRCITLTLEKTNNPLINKMIENFNKPEILEIKRTFDDFGVVWCDVVTQKNNVERWNNYIKNIYTPNNTIHITTPNNITTQVNNTEEIKMFDKINNTGIDGRHLEIFFPLFILSKIISEECFEQTLIIAKNIVSERKTEEMIESKDVMFINFIAEYHKGHWINEYVKIGDILFEFRLYTGYDMKDKEFEWLNAKWIGRALKRLNLISQKRRLRNGCEVIIDIEKAKCFIKRQPEHYTEKSIEVEKVKSEEKASVQPPNQVLDIILKKDDSISPSDIGSLL